VKVIDGLNYWGSGPMTAVQQERVKKLDLNLINNRINYNSAITHSSNVVEHKIAFDENREGQISVPRLNLQVPLVWSKDSADFETDLARGVIHYPGTAMPGEQGTMYVSGHSSDYIWKRNDYKRVFAQINALQPGDDIFVNAYGTDGKLASVRHIGISASVSYPDLTPNEVIVDRTLDVARQCIEQDGAEAILMGCTLQSCPLTVAGATEAQGAPIIDPVLVGMKWTEAMVDMQRAGIPIVSRYGAWQKPPAAEVELLGDLAQRAEAAIARTGQPA
jgi:hypothetical protein